jgi:hypothetical protein
MLVFKVASYGHTLCEVKVNKHQVAIAQANRGAQIFSECISLLKTCATVACIVGCIWIIMDGLKSMVQANPANISAMSQVVEKLNISSIMGWLVGLGGVGYGAIERSGRKRLLTGYAKQRRAIEANDPYNASSGLTETGDTPQ